MDELVYAVVKLQHDAITRGELALWTVYDRPRDFPDSYVARMFVIRDGAPVATEHAVQGKKLDALRELLSRAGLVCLTRHDSDAPTVVETWV